MYIVINRIKVKLKIKLNYVIVGRKLGNFKCYYWKLYGKSERDTGRERIFFFFNYTQYIIVVL